MTSAYGWYKSYVSECVGEFACVGFLLPLFGPPGNLKLVTEVLDQNWLALVLCPTYSAFCSGRKTAQFTWD